LEPTAGEILIGNDNLQNFNKISFRKKVSYVFQDSLLITGSLKENITLKNSCYAESDIEKVLTLSEADSVVARMSDGLNHKIGFDGSDLSGGERQKIAIARALIRNPEILIFDEVTNHLDYTSRLKMRDLIVSLRGKVTVLMVSHDPELTALCDQEINLNLNGEIKNA
jgi:ATP-binding cassette subfamily C protein